MLTYLVCIQHDVLSIGHNFRVKQINGKLKQHDDGEANKVAHLPYLITKNSCFARFAIARALFTFSIGNEGLHETATGYGKELKCFSPPLLCYREGRIIGLLPMDLILSKLLFWYMSHLADL